MLSALTPFALLFGVAIACFFLSNYVHSDVTGIGSSCSQTKPNSSCGKVRRVVPSSAESRNTLSSVDRGWLWRKIAIPKTSPKNPKEMPQPSSSFLLTSICRPLISVNDVTPADYSRFLIDRIIKQAEDLTVRSSACFMMGSMNLTDQLEVPSSSSSVKSSVTKHYACPPISVDTLRRRYGSSKGLGDWSVSQTRRFYKSQLPKSLQSKLYGSSICASSLTFNFVVDGALGLNLEERARLASEARHALRLYSRERSIFVARVLAELYDGIRHVQLFGYWSSEGMTWEEVKMKYRKEAKKVLGEEATAEIIDRYVYLRIIERACATNSVFDNIAQERLDFHSLGKLISAFKVSPESASIPPFLRDLLPLLFLIVPIDSAWSM